MAWTIKERTVGHGEIFKEIVIGICIFRNSAFSCNPSVTTSVVVVNSAVIEEAVVYHKFVYNLTTWPLDTNPTTYHSTEVAVAYLECFQSERHGLRILVDEVVS